MTIVDKEKTLREQMASVRRVLILRALAANGCNIGNAAAQLGMHRNHLSKMCEVLKIDTVGMKQDATVMDRRYGLRLAPFRYRLPTTRVGLTHKFTIDGRRGYVNVGLFDDGQPGEIFIKIDKVGTMEHGMTDCFSIAFSMLLQQGTPLAKLVEKFSRTRFAPNGKTDNPHPHLSFTSSVIDYVVRWLELRFVLGVPSPPVGNSIDASKCKHGYASKGNCPTCRQGR